MGITWPWMTFLVSPNADRGIDTKGNFGLKIEIYLYNRPANWTLNVTTVYSGQTKLRYKMTDTQRQTDQRVFISAEPTRTTWHISRVIRCNSTQFITRWRPSGFGPSAAGWWESPWVSTTPTATAKRPSSISLSGNGATLPPNAKGN